MIHSELGNEADGWAGNGLVRAMILQEGKVHLTIHEQTSCGEEVAVVTHDLKNCFDSIDTTFPMNVGQGLGFPVEVAECKKTHFFLTYKAVFFQRIHGWRLDRCS